MTEPRQPKLTREELRLLLLDTGRTLLIEEGLGTGVDTLTFKRVFERVEADTGRRISNASVIRRVWENLADYQADVLVTIAGQDGLGEFDETFTALEPVFASLRPLVRRGARPLPAGGLSGWAAPANILALLESPHWSLWIAVWALATAENLRPDGQRFDHQLRIRQALLEGYEGTTRLWEDAYGSLAPGAGPPAPPPADRAPVHRDGGRAGRGLLAPSASRSRHGRDPPPHRARRRGPGVVGVRHRPGGPAAPVLRARSRVDAGPAGRRAGG